MIKVTNTSFIILLLYLLFFSIIKCYAKDTLIVKGFGSDRNTAIQDALRLAIEQQYGVLISSQSLVKNLALTDDRIFSFSKGYAAKFDIEKEGLYQTNIM